MALLAMEKLTLWLLVLLLAVFAACKNSKECLSHCERSYAACVERTQDAEKCLFFRQDCEGRCE